MRRDRSKTDAPCLQCALRETHIIRPVAQGVHSQCRPLGMVALSGHLVFVTGSRIVTVNGQYLGMYSFNDLEMQSGHSFDTKLQRD